uniref:Uncharacterized protein n=1 Tax=Arundo donax TaxID=35708 RepID=A0A0A9EZ25_ARUDO
MFLLLGQAQFKKRTSFWKEKAKGSKKTRS